MKLYYLVGACSFVPHTALEWINQPYEAEAVNHSIIKSDEYLALNPQGAVPLLVDGSLALSQNIAILTYLDSLYPEAELLGSRHPQEKAKAMRWLSFFNSDVHKAFAPLFRLPTYAKGQESLAKEIRQLAEQSVLNYLSIADTHLQNHLFFGEKICVADVYLYVILGWCKKLNVDYSQFSTLNDFIARVESDDGVDRVRIQEGLK